MQDSGNYSNRGCKFTKWPLANQQKKPKTKTNKKREKHQERAINIPLPCEALLSYGLRAADVINRSSFSRPREEYKWQWMLGDQEVISTLSQQSPRLLIQRQSRERRLSFNQNREKTEQ